MRDFSNLRQQWVSNVDRTKFPNIKVLFEMTLRAWLLNTHLK